MHSTQPTHQCATCAAITDAPREQLITEYTDDLCDRPLIREECIVLVCPSCGSVDLREVIMCERCHRARAEDGMDLCTACGDEIDAMLTVAA